MDQCVKQLSELHGQLTFQAGDTFFWSPSDQMVHYDARATGNEAIWSLLHETSHGLLAHTNFGSDFELLQLEIEAWERATQLTTEVNAPQISRDYIEDCLDTYRDWLHKRATCPTCGQVSLQNAPGAYQCMNCATGWQVTPNRHCRPYRMRSAPHNTKTAAS